MSDYASKRLPSRYSRTYSETTSQGSVLLLTNRMALRHLVLRAAIFLVLAIYTSSSSDANVLPKPADLVSQDDTKDSVEYPRPGRLSAFLDEEYEPEKTVKDIPGLTEDMVAKALSEARREVLDEEKNVKRDGNRKTRGHSYQSLHYNRDRYNPALEPERKRALILERTTKKLADTLG